MRIALAAFAIAAAAALPAAARFVVQTQQSVTYDLPEGWAVDRWTEKTGEAILKNAATGDLIIVERYGLTGDTPTYPNSEALGDRTLTWDYVETKALPGDFTLQAQVTFADAKTAARISIFASSPKLKGIDKTADLAAIRAIASSIKVLGARKCWPPGECPPGEVKDVK